MELDKTEDAVLTEKPENELAEIQQDKEEKKTQNSPIFETIWKKYSETDGKTVPQSNIKIFAQEYWTAQGLSEETVKELLDKKIPTQDTYNVQEIKEILEGISTSPPLNFPMITVNLEEQVSCSAPAILQHFSEEVIKSKLGKHSSQVQEILNMEPKPEIGKLLRNVFTQCQFGIIQKSMMNQSEAEIDLNKIIKFYFSLYKDQRTELNITTLEDLLINFVKQNHDYMGIDITNELKLYTGELLPEKFEASEAFFPANVPKPIKNSKTALQENAAGELVVNLQNTITMYENLYAQQKSQNKNTSHTSRLLSMLRSQMREIQATEVNECKSTNSISHRKAPQVTSIENNIKVLKEIFQFYNKQRTLAHPRKTFDEVANEICTMNMGYFFKFLKDFEIDVELKRVKELYVRTAIAGRELHFEQFIELIKAVAVEIEKKKRDISSVSTESCFLELLFESVL